MNRPSPHIQEWIYTGFFLLAITISCTTKSTIKKEKTVLSKWNDLPAEFREQALPDTACKQMSFDSIAIETDVNKLAAVISCRNHVNDKAVGYAGEFTVEYASYERIQKIATDEELVSLTGHSAPAVRVYALFGLRKRKSPLYERARMTLLNDNAVVYEFSGCSGRPGRVSYYAIAEPEPF